MTCAHADLLYVPVSLVLSCDSVDRNNYQQVCSQLRASAVNATLHAFAAVPRAAAPLLLGTRRSPLSTDISRQYGAQQQTRAHDGARRKDRQTPGRFINPALHTTRAVSKIHHMTECKSRPEDSLITMCHQCAVD